MVLRDRNHPSIICWSIGNEVIERKEIRVVHTARLLKQAILECDRTRPVTEALCAWDSDWEIYDPHFEVLDIGGYNYMIFKHASDHQRAPQRVMWQTESFPRDAFRNWATVNDNPVTITRVSARARAMWRVDSLTGMVPAAAMWISLAGASPSAITVRCCGTTTPAFTWL